MITYNDKLKEKAKRAGIRTTISDEWISQVIKAVILSEKELSSFKTIGQEYLKKNISDWEIINFAEYFIMKYINFTGKPFNGLMNDLTDHVETVYRWNEGKRNHHEVVKDYISLFFERCKSEPKLVPNSSLFANRKNCEILDGMYEFKKKKQNKQSAHIPKEHSYYTEHRTVSSTEMLEKMLGGS